MTQEFKFPDEQDKDLPEDNLDIELEIEDDTPEKDKGKEPIPKEMVDKFDAADDEEELDEKAQALRLKQYKKVYHDERRAKEAAFREQKEAIDLAKRVMEENKKLREQYSAGEKTYIETVQSQADLQVQVAQRAYKEALESGDPDRIVEAQTVLNDLLKKYIEALKAGDKILTIGGIYGTIQKMNDDGTIIMAVEDGTKMKISKSHK